MRSLALLTVAVGLAGCGIAQQQEITNADIAFEKRKAECSAQYPGARQHIDWMNCTAAARIATLAARKLLAGDQQ